MSPLYTYTKALSVALGYRDFLTQLHSERVAALSEEIGMGCGLSEKELDLLKIAASFHDIGKIGIPDQILLKPSPLDEVELEEMKQHAEIGEKIMASVTIAPFIKRMMLLKPPTFTQSIPTIKLSVKMDMTGR